MNNYLEKEFKVLDVSLEKLAIAFKKIGAKKVFDGQRLFTTFDYPALRLNRKGQDVRLTEEAKLKLSFSSRINPKAKEVIKLFVSRKKETVDFLDRLGLVPIAECQSHRTSWEWKGIDFDLDQFPQIPPFLEIDVNDSNLSFKQVLKLLGLESHEVATLGTKEVYSKYGKDYLKLFKIKRRPIVTRCPT
ncbi:MAG TPA: hypothetical protein VMW41_06275 [Candidatus Bathyarchaeia archaeon]|nr:hypothetical protein [Candidatus Bathyarchaeia archaeon]